MRNAMLFSVALSIVTLAGCAEDDGGDPAFQELPAMCATKTYDKPTMCAATEWKYTDQLCHGIANPDAGPACMQAGDLTCYQLCEKDSDCDDPCRPDCRTFGLFQFGDSDGNGTSPRVCGAPSFRPEN